MQINRRLILITIFLVLAGLACRAEINQPNAQLDQATSTPAATPTPLPPAPVNSGSSNPAEPTSIIGNIPYTSPFFLDSTSEPFVLLEDEAGFVHRNLDFQFPLAGQVMGPVIIHEDKSLTYELALPAVPQGTYVDVDNNNKQDTGVQVFAVAYWDNTWGGPFLEERDGTGWSSAYSSTIVDPNNHNEITGGTLVVWAPDDQQSFPTGFGPDGLLFTADDPTAPIPAGYTLVNLSAEPFEFSKQARPELDLNEGVGALNDYSGLSYSDAFDALFQKVSREYPFTNEKNLDWQALYNQFKPRVEKANNPEDFYIALRDFTYAIPDGHVGLQLDAQVFQQERGGGFGLNLAELSDGRVIVTQVFPDLPAEKAGIQTGAEILSWGGIPVQQALDQVVPYFGPYSTDQAKREGQVTFLTRVSPGERIPVSYINPGGTTTQQTTLTAVPEFDSLREALGLNDLPILPIEAKILQPSGLGYIRINTFEDDFHLMAQLWERYIQDFQDRDVPGIIIDVRNNSGGNPGLAENFAGFFFDKEIELFRRSYYNEKTQKFEYEEQTEKIKPAPVFFDRPVAVLVGPNCVSACEEFAYTMQQNGDTIIVGSYPTAGAFGEVGRGQYKLPDGMSMQFPTGRAETMDGKVLIEGTGVIPDIKVPVTEQNVLGQVDAVLEAAIQALLGKIQ
jgi:C-terminal processing protease CtpA/Prc